MKKYMLDQLAKMIDHTNLKATATTDEIKTLCFQAIDHQFASACFNPVKVRVAGEILANTNIKACSVVGFPLGQNTIEAKVFETTDALANGATEIDYVINISEALEGNWDYIKREMEAIVAICNKAGVLSKVIFENSYLSENDIKKLCGIASVMKPSFVKTSTGTTETGATEADVALMNRLTPDCVEVKASGGIRNADQFIAMIKAGATRVGASAGIGIMEELEAKYFANDEKYLEI